LKIPHLQQYGTGMGTCAIFPDVRSSTFSKICILDVFIF
jgi:hypothetical protein